MAVLYVYFQFSLPWTEKDLVSTLLLQLCQQHPRVSELMASSPIQQLPDLPLTLDLLVEELSRLLGHFNEVFVVVDAIDEYRSDQRNVLRLLETILHSKLGNVHLLISCRPHSVDCGSVRTANEYTISVSGPAVSQDIEIFIRHALDRSRFFGRSTASTQTERDELSRQLVESSDGMCVVVPYHL